MMASPLLGQEDYVDFSDMGSYDHGFQVNRINGDKPKWSLEKTETNVPKAEAPALYGINVENASRPMKFLQRVVKSLLRQMNVQSHVFGPGEAITIDLQAEIKYNDYVILNKFVKELDDSDKYLSKIDDIVSNLIHVVDHSGSRLDYFDFFFSMPIFYSLKFWLVLMTMTVICFLIIMLSVRTVYASSNVVMLLYGFLIIYILSCIWTFSHMYEDAKAANYAKLMQTRNPPKDCDYESLGFWDSASYFIRVNFFGHKDQCEQYYSTSMTDPFWSVNPLEAISKSFSVLVFSPFGYIGDKVGLFFGGIVNGIPFWLQPLLIILVFGFLFMSISGYRIVSPLFTIEPARRGYLDQGSETVGPSITNRVNNELVERPERPVMKSVKDAATDMDDFESYLNGCPNDGNRRSRPLYLNQIIDYMLTLWNIVIEFLDTVLRQCPENVNMNEAEENLFRREPSFNPVPEVEIAPEQRNEDEDVIIVSRRQRRSVPACECDASSPERGPKLNFEDHILGDDEIDQILDASYDENVLNDMIDFNNLNPQRPEPEPGTSSSKTI